MNMNIMFQPSGVVADINKGETVLQAAQRNGVYIEASCGGVKVCGKCRIRLLGNHVDSSGTTFSMKNASSVTDLERKLLGEAEILKNYRLACMVEAHGNLAVEVLSEDARREGVIMHEGLECEIMIKPAVKQYELKLEKPTLKDFRDDLSRLKDSLFAIDENIDKEIEAETSVIRTLPTTLREGKWHFTATVLYGKRIILLEQGAPKPIYGIAVDVGTTTVAAYLCDLSSGRVCQTASMMNPQIPYGDDVLTRVAACMDDENALERLRKTIMDGLNTLICQMTEKEGISKNQVMEAALVFNTVMHHITLGIPPNSLAVSPFVPSVSSSLDMRASELGLDIMAQGNVHCLPAVAGFIGGDLVAVLLAEVVQNQKNVRLIVDIGTNSEICLDNKGDLYATSCATGPALEGAQIQCGIRAVRGAIEKVIISPDSLEPILGIIGGPDASPPIGICGSGIIDAVAQMVDVGILEPDGKFSRITSSRRIRKDEKGKLEYVLYEAVHPGESDIVVTQKDVRAVQLAKAALYAGVKSLMNRCKVEEIDEIILAGAFGSYIDKKNALRLGLFPDCPLTRVTAVGNAAGIGARMVLLNEDKREEAKSLARQVEFIETAMHSDYQMMFAEAMAIPHRSDVFTSNEEGKWGCSGKDDRFLIQEVKEMGMDVFSHVELLDKAVHLQCKHKNNPSRVFPLMQKMEAVVFGAEPQLVGQNYTFGNYPYKNVIDIDITASMIDHPSIRVMLECIARNSEERIIVEVSGPFSVLAALINPIQLYKYAKKNPGHLKEILSTMTNWLVGYTIKCLEAGAQVISFADPEGVMEIVGERFYKDFSGLATAKYLKELEPYLEKSLVHICGKTSSSLIKAGFVRTEVQRVALDVSYHDILGKCAKNSKIRFIGQSCIHTEKLDVPIVKRLVLC